MVQNIFHNAVHFSKKICTFANSNKQIKQQKNEKNSIIFNHCSRCIDERLR